ncbi:hypothetical protein DL96DRAFT_1671098 [Flagelloscypha sp. PMI_526]|nr:hypothetical protein DL96DRAFT_1671098 [Flagelloscypha sp. PMI_526]
MLSAFALALFALAGSAAGHAVVTAPSPRTSGTAQAAACGAAVTKKLNSDKYGPIEVAYVAKDANWTEACDLFFCRAYFLSDNTARVQSYTPGQSVAFHVDIAAHHTGYANVSVVDLVAKKTIGSPLFYWPVYANSSLGPSEWPKNESDFNVVIPTDLGTKCSTAGACAIQWYWHATENNQTYESCVDFTA